MAEALFKAFDEDNNGALSFYEYMLVKTAPKLDNIEDRLGWLFNAFDNDGGGSIDNLEVIKEILLKKIIQKIFFIGLQNSRSNLQDDWYEIISKT